MNPASTYPCLPTRAGANAAHFSIPSRGPRQPARENKLVRIREGAGGRIGSHSGLTLRNANPARTYSNRPRSPERARTPLAGVGGDINRHSFLIVRCSSPAQGAVPNPTPPTGRLHPFRRIVAALVFAVMASSATAHEFYAPECCNDKDCAPLPADAVSATPKGWLVKPTGEVVPYQSHKLRSAPDGQFHGCFVGGDANKTMLCLYVPPQGF